MFSNYEEPLKSFLMQYLHTFPVNLKTNYVFHNNNIFFDEHSQHFIVASPWKTTVEPEPEDYGDFNPNKRTWFDLRMLVFLRQALNHYQLCLARHLFHLLLCEPSRKRHISIIS